MLPPEAASPIEALNIVTGKIKQGSIDKIDLETADGHYLAEELAGPPAEGAFPFDPATACRSSCDGFALTREFLGPRPPPACLPERLVRSVRNPYFGRYAPDSGRYDEPASRHRREPVGTQGPSDRNLRHPATRPSPQVRARRASGGAAVLGHCLPARG